MVRDLLDHSTDHLIDRAEGCLLGGALGDALGAPVEFMSESEIFSKYCQHVGIEELSPAYGRIGAITDDTQMTLFCAEGLIRSVIRSISKGICHPPSVVGYSLQRWLHTQGGKASPFAIQPDTMGWLALHRDLYHRRSPGQTNIESLKVWNQHPARNESLGCGALVRSAPFGFFPEPAELANECAWITHGSKDARTAAALYAVIIRNLVLGMELEPAILDALEIDRVMTQSSKLLRKAIDLAKQGRRPEETIGEFGGGRRASEVLAIGAYCALRAHGNFWIGLRFAVNHAGASASTGGICGGLMGATAGMQTIPFEPLEHLELRHLISQVAKDMINVQRLSSIEDASSYQRLMDEMWVRYPGC